MNGFVALPALPTSTAITTHAQATTCSAQPPPSSSPAVSRRGLLAAVAAATAAAAMPRGSAQAENIWDKITRKNATIQPIDETAPDKGAAIKSKIVDKEAKAEAAASGGPRAEGAKAAAEGAAAQLKK
jgi:hypothetical protein